MLSNLSIVSVHFTSRYQNIAFEKFTELVIQNLTFAMAAPSTSSVAAKMEDVKIRPFSYPQIEAAFAERPDLKERIYNMIREFVFLLYI